jgi:hypothetical protein
MRRLAWRTLHRSSPPAWRSQAPSDTYRPVVRLGFATPDEEGERRENHRLLRTIPFFCTKCLMSGLHGKSCRDWPAALRWFVSLMTVRHDGAERRP